MLRKVYGVIVVLGVTMLVLRVADRLARRGASLPPVPVPNGYEEILKVAGELGPLETEPSEMNREATIREAESTRAKIQPVHTLLRTNVAVPLNTAPGWVDAHAQDIKSLRRLAVAQGIEARAQELGGNTNQAARTLVDLIYLGQAMRRGGVYVDAINGLVVETIGVGMLRPKVRFLDGATCRGALQELEGLEAKREPAEIFLEREQAWSRASFGLVSRTMTWFRKKADAERSAKFVQKYDESPSPENMDTVCRV